MSARTKRSPIVRGLFAQLMVVVAVLTGAAFALAQEGGGASNSASASASASVSVSASGTGTGVSPISLPAALLPSPVYTTGLTPVPAGQSIPKAWLPPGADDPDPGPSVVVFPHQLMTIRFNHKKHVQGQNLKCQFCHVKAAKSVMTNDMLIPTDHTRCVQCHSIDEKQPVGAVAKAGDDPKTIPTRCDFCHVGAKVDASTGAVTVAPMKVPNAVLKMSHKAHLDKAIKCEQCHGEVGNLELATRDQMPRMKGCFACHQSGEAGGIGGFAGAKTACSTCHLTDKSNVQLQTAFITGQMLPPKWLKNAKHGPDWIERHKKVAGNDSQFCANCHKEEECTDCHDGKTKPLSVHPNDWLNMHEVAARFDQPKCVTCHSTTNFCLPCHTRVGITDPTSGPSGVTTTARFHPPADVWSAPVRKAGHHAFEAQKNINACVSCHVERDCVFCHGTQGAGGNGANPHGLKFRDKCTTMYAKNPRPCFVCHDPYDKELDACR
jgi:hypothetical protein